MIFAVENAAVATERKGRMAVQFAQPYRFSEQQLARMAEAGILPRAGTHLVDGVPYRAGAPIRFSTDDYFRLGESGVFHEGDRVELIDGEIIEMSPEGSRHSACIRRLIRYLAPRVGTAFVGAQHSLSLPDGYWPRPDVVVLRPSEDEYEHAHPTHQDALVVIEVSDTSLRGDRHVKAGRYALAGIPEYWLVDLTRDRVSVHLSPVAGHYAEVRVYGSGARWASPGLGGLEIAVDEVLKPRREG
ncbi:MAG: Uma2 family endonuclease [Gemmatimonadetes bacterium]|nr:Uma2 family endonuclease [Gemmatimonadota bacterium]